MDGGVKRCLERMIVGMEGEEDRGRRDLSVIKGLLSACLSRYVPGRERGKV